MRESGILMHITSLPGPYGIGTMGVHAYRFVDFLHKAGQKKWQILPLTPTGYGNSPYQSSTTFGGNYYLIDLDQLVEEGLLQKEEILKFSWGDREDRVDFGKLYENRLTVLKMAYARFAETEEFQNFCRENGSWLPDYALYMALKDEHGGAPWYQWEENLKRRDADALWQARREKKTQIRFYSFLQFQFYKQWQKLRKYAGEKGVEIIGDVPIYVPLDSADVWSAPELFLLDENLTPTAVAGCPPDGFTEDGQLWGNPLYRWETHKKDGYCWWLRRLEAASKCYDVVRLDHFRGLESYWAVPYGDKTAKNGHWEPGPGMALIDAVKKNLKNIKLIAEDLGFLTPEVLQLRDDSGFPGMKVLEFAFDSREPSVYLPHTYEKNTVCYTGTHDNMTAVQWLKELSEDALFYAREYMSLTREEGYVWGMIRTAMASVSGLCIIQMQDYLELDGSARMNFPGTQSDDNWVWRAKETELTDTLAEKICRLARLYGR